MNPLGMFKDGKRLQEWTTKNLLPMSGKLIPEFDRRKSIRDMFSRKPTLSKSETTNSVTLETPSTAAADTPTASTISEVEETISTNTSQDTSNFIPSPETSMSERPGGAVKRPQKSETPAPPPKRAKSGSAPSDKGTSGKGQQTLKGFFKPKTTPSNGLDGAKDSPKINTFSQQSTSSFSAIGDGLAASPEIDTFDADDPESLFIPLNENENDRPVSQPSAVKEPSDDEVIDPIASKESWSKLFNKRAAPRCESHNEPCTSYVTKKPGINCGRSFWLCARPLGPSGNKEKGTQWRCPTFIWASDWNGSGPSTGG